MPRCDAGMSTWELRNAALTHFTLPWATPAPYGSGSASTRMKSRHPNVLQHLAGRPLLAHVLAAAAPLQPRRVVVRV